MATENKVSLNNILQDVLSVAGQEQSMFYSPKIYSSQRSVVESLLLSKLVENYPKDQTVIDQIAPFVEIVTKNVVNGFVELPENYRNILGTPMVFANPDSTGECQTEELLTPQTFKAGQLKAGCRLNPVIIVPQSEFALKTRSTYDAPTWEKPIGYFAGANKFKVCPFDISRVSIMYVRKERKVIFGYVQQPDDTYLYDPSTTVETEFNSNAFTPILNAMVALYSAYAKNQSLQNWAVLLKERGIL